MFFNLTQIETIADNMIKAAKKEKLLEALQIIQRLLFKIEKRIKELDNETGKNKI